MKTKEFNKETENRCGIKFNSYTACAFAEGFCEGENATDLERIEAFSYIAKTKLWKGLQGFYGRTIQNLVDNGIMNWEGVINYETLEELIES